MENENKSMDNFEERISTLQSEEEQINILLEYENKEAELSDITNMLWYILDDYDIGTNNVDIHTKADYYDKLICYLSNIYFLLNDRCLEMRHIIDSTYDKKGVNDNVYKGNNQKQKIQN